MSNSKNSKGVFAAQTYPYSAGLKAAIAHFSDDESWHPVRPPLMALDEAETANLVQLLETAGYTPLPVG